MVKTTENYWKEVKGILGDNYENFDFSDSVFTGCTKPIRYFCKNHNKWVEKKEARELLNNSYGCGICVTEKRKKTKIEKSKKNFFEEGPKIHNNFFTYGNVVYIDTITPVLITCPIHGDFLQKPIKHITGKQGCNKCGEKRTADGQRMGKDEFIRRSIEKHGHEHYGYHLVDNYINCDTNVEIFCNVCKKSFQQTPYNHIHRSGCTDCGIIKRATLMKQLASERFWTVAKNDERFDFSKFVYDKASTKSIAICKKCYEPFTISPNNYLRGKGCPTCCLKTKKKI